MKPRILKKLSKKALAIFATSPRRDFQQSVQRSWIDDEFELDYLTTVERAKSSAKERLHRQTRVSVNHVPSIGGEYDSYAGEGSDFCSFFEHAAAQVLAASIDWKDYDWESYDHPESSIKGRLTGKKVLELLRINASEVPS